MRVWKKILLVVFVVLVCLGALFVLLIGPWPTYGTTDFRGKGYYREAIAAVDRQGQTIDLREQPERLRAAWSYRRITPHPGTPLAGFGDRQGRPSEGVRDELYVKALALSDGADTAVVVGSDMLIVPENLADAVRARVSRETPLDPSRILFNATHTHSGPGAWAPGFMARGFAGPYDPRVLDRLVQSFSLAIADAVAGLEPASVAWGNFEAPDLIRNRARDGAVDARVGYLVVEQEDGDRCYVVRFSAHPTVLGGDNMLFSGDFPGHLQREIEDRTGAFALYLGGAVGSMGARAPEGPDAYSRAAALGRDLAERVLDAAGDIELRPAVEVAAVGAPLTVPPFQARLNLRWRLSPYAFRLAGVDDDAWIQGVRLGDLVLVGMPCDFSGELSCELREWASGQGIDLWMLSFNGDYVGYISPDRYYSETDEDGRLGYETGFMSWCGPDAGDYFCELTRHTVGVLTGSADSTS